MLRPLFRFGYFYVIVEHSVLSFFPTVTTPSCFSFWSHYDYGYVKGDVQVSRSIKLIARDESGNQTYDTLQPQLKIPNHKILKVSLLSLKGRVMQLYNNKYMIASTQITSTEIFAFIVVLVFKLLRRKVLFRQ